LSSRKKTLTRLALLYCADLSHRLPPNPKLTSERRKHNNKVNETPPPKEKALIPPEQSESGAADVRRL